MDLLHNFIEKLLEFPSLPIENMYISLHQKIDKHIGVFFRHRKFVGTIKL